MLYAIHNADLTALITEEVSRIAAGAYSDDGVSLYDSIAIHSRDADDVSRAIRDAVDAVVRRTADICTYIPATPALSFYVPDMDTTKETLVGNELDRAISLGATATWLREKYPSRAQEYTDKANVALELAIGYLKTRTQPTRS